jgi:hypothetical protein
MVPAQEILVGDDPAEVVLVARGIATAVAPPDGLTESQAHLLEAVALALTGVDVDYRSLDPLDAKDLAACLSGHDDEYRHRIVQHMVLGELVLRPIPTEVAFRVAQYAEALDVRDDFVRVARRYAQGAYGLAWIDLQRNGFADHVVASNAQDAPDAGAHTPRPAFEPAEEDPELADRWREFSDLDEDTLGRSVFEMYEGRGFSIPGTPGGAPKYLAQHDFVHVLADYGTNLQGELEVFALIARADPDPKGFAWLATLFGLFETGYIASTGFFVRDTDGGHHADAPGMNHRIADAIRRGKEVCRTTDQDLFEIPYYDLATHTVEDVRRQLGVPSKSESVLAEGSPGTFALEGMSESQRRTALQRKGEQV